MKIAKIMTLAIAILLLSSTAILCVNAQVTPVPAPNGVYDQLTSSLINAGMYWTGMTVNVTGLPAQGQTMVGGVPTREVLWNRFHDQIPTHCYVVAAPDLIGVGQTCNLVMFNPQVPPGSTALNGIRYFYKLKITKPDGTVLNLPTASTVGGKTQPIVNGAFQSDSTGTTYYRLLTDAVGNWTVTLTFLQFQYLWNSANMPGALNDYYGTTFLSSNWTTTLTVQQQPVSVTGLTAPAYPPLPTAFWTRPIEGENTGWATIASNWLNDEHDYNNGGYQTCYQPDGTAPNTGHILWTRPTEDMGVVGGSANYTAGIPGQVYNAGSQYQPRFTTKIILNGRLYYSPNLYYSGSSELLDCVDLKTGQLLWERNTTGLAVSGLLGVSYTALMPTFGYLYDQEDINEHGIENPGWLFTTNYAVGYQPTRGLTYLHIANVPGSAQPASAATGEILGPSGENLRYVFTNVGTPASPNWYLAEWNSSRVIPLGSAGGNPTQLLIEGNIPITPSQPTTLPYPYNTFMTFSIFGLTPRCAWAWGGSSWVIVDTATNAIVDTTATTVGHLVDTATIINTGNQLPSYDWNMTSPIEFTTAPTVAAASLTNGILWGWNSSVGWPTGTSGPSYAYEDSVTIWAISLKPSSRGSLIYMKTFVTDDPATNQNIMIEHADADAGSDGVFVTIEIPSMMFSIYDMRTGTLIGNTDAQANTITPYGYYTWPSLISMTQTKIAYGMLYTGGYSGSVSAYNLTNAALVWRYQVIPPGTAGILKSSPGMMVLIADGKVYVGCHEHSALTPLESGNDIKCLNATTGKLIWEMSGWVYPLSAAVADGVLIYWNDYDGQIYAVGQGPSATTVQAPLTGVTVGDQAVIQGTVMDVSAGTKQTEQAADFPNGVPCVSDASMSAWMEYVYMQKAMPSDVTGVTVTLDAIDPNNNFIHIGTATSDASGLFSYAWAPPNVPGKYTIIATFSGSESYYGSYAETAMVVQAAAPTAPPTSAPVTGLASTWTVELGIVAVIIVIIIIGVAIMLMLRKRP